MKLAMIFIISIIVLALGSKILVPTFGNYSDGERSGIMQKLSHKGVFFKTYEGELALEGIQSTTKGIINSTFLFTVKDDAIVAQLDSLSGKRVSLHYIQVFHRNRFDGDTEYTVDKVTLVK